MNIALIIVVVAVFVAAVYVLFRENALWKEYYAGSARHPDRALEIFSKLSRNGVRASLRNTGGARSVATGADVTMYVLVHRADLERAREIVPLEEE